MNWLELLLRLLGPGDEGYNADEEIVGLLDRLGQTTRRNDDGTYEAVEVEGVEALTDDELGVLRGFLIGLAEDEDTSNTLLVEAANAVDAIAAIEEVREAEAVAEETERAAAVARLRGETASEGGEGDGDAAEGDGAEGTEGEGDGTESGDEGEGSGDGEGGDAGEGAEGVEAGEPVGATASSSRATARRQAAARRPASHRPAARGTNDGAGRITIGADVPGHTAGAEVDSLRHIDQAIGRRLEAFRRGSKGGDGETIAVATIHANYPANRVLTDDAAQNSRIIGEVVQAGLQPEAMAAAGGLCAPLQTAWGVEVMGTTERPIRDALTSFQAARGGLITVEPPQLPAVSGSTTIWTMDDDVEAGEPDSDLVKPCVTVVCGNPRTTEVEAMPTCITWGNVRRRTFGEWDAAITQLSMVEHARFAERRLFGQLVAESLALSDEDTVVSAYRDWLTLMIQAATNYRIRHRDEGLRFRVIAPSQLPAIFSIDFIRGMSGGNGWAENFRRARAEIAADLTIHGISATWSPDIVAVGPQAAATPLADLPPQVPTLFFPEGTFIHLDAGELDLGIVRDSTLNAKNNFQTFAESFEAAHHLGHESFQLDVNVCPSGAVNGTLDPAPICASYT